MSNSNWKQKLYNTKPQKKYAEDDAAVVKMKEMVAAQQAKEALEKAAPQLTAREALDKEAKEKQFGVIWVPEPVEETK